MAKHHQPEGGGGEGAFLGFGGQRVSEAEKATLSDIAKSLGTTA